MVCELYLKKMAWKQRPLTEGVGEAGVWESQQALLSPRREVALPASGIGFPVLLREERHWLPRKERDNCEDLYKLSPKCWWWGSSCHALVTAQKPAGMVAVCLRNHLEHDLPACASSNRFGTGHALQPLQQLAQMCSCWSFQNKTLRFPDSVTWMLVHLKGDICFIDVRNCWHLA